MTIESRYYQSMETSKKELESGFRILLSSIMTTLRQYSTDGVLRLEQLGVAKLAVSRLIASYFEQSGVAWTSGGLAVSQFARLFNNRAAWSIRALYEELVKIAPSDGVDPRLSFAAKPDGVSPLLIITPALYSLVGDAAQETARLVVRRIGLLALSGVGMDEIERRLAIDFGLQRGTPRVQLSYPALRLLRTETTRIYGEALRRMVADHPFLEKEIWWSLHGSHRCCDVCDGYAAGSPYAPNSLPPYPAHPNCMCSLSVKKNENKNAPIDWSIFALSYLPLLLGVLSAEQ